MKGNRKITRKRSIALFLAITMLISSILSGNGISLSRQVQAAGATTIKSKWGNVLREGASFSFYGKGNRTSMWTFDANMEIGGQMTAVPVLCLEPTKKMSSNMMATIEEIEMIPENFPIQLATGTYMTLDQAEALYYILRECYMSDDQFLGSNSMAPRIVAQCAVWAVMSGEWDGVENFAASLNPVIANLKDQSIVYDVQFWANTVAERVTNYTDETNIPSFASRYLEFTEPHVMEKQEDGTYIKTFDIDSKWAVSSIVWDLPEGWDFQLNEDKTQITFICKNNEPNISISGRYVEGSNAYNYMYRPSYLNIVRTGSEAYQVMIAPVGAATPWNVYTRFNTDLTIEPGVITPGNYEIEINRRKHEEQFDSEYSMDLVKLDDETGKELEGATFEVLEYFDSSQLSGTRLETNQIDSWDEWKVCAEEITDSNGYFLHTDYKRYVYHKGYCDGHPDPIITYFEYDGEDEEGEEYTQELNAQLEADAWAAWWEEVQRCEDMLHSGEIHFHSIEPEVAKRQLEEDRDATYEDFISLEYGYSAREIKARTGYILHGNHNDDIPIEKVSFSSSQSNGKSNVINADLTFGKQEQNKDKTIEGFENVSYRMGTMVAAQNNVEELNQEEELQEIKLATPSKAAYSFSQNGTIQKYESAAYIMGDVEWLSSQVNNVTKGPKGNIGYNFEVRDHRTEGRIQINKRDKELHEIEKDESYGKSQGDGTLEGAVYGLYAAEDIIHPDGKTGRVFSAGELVAITTTDKNGDGTFLVITEITETSKDVPNLYNDNVLVNGNQWIGRPLILGNYYIEEIARSEGYELSRYGANLRESNRFVSSKTTIAKSGETTTTGFYTRINEFLGSWMDFDVKTFNTQNGYDIYVTGYPAGTSFYQVELVAKSETTDVIKGSEIIDKVDAEGNPVYKLAQGGEYKYNPDGTRIIKTDGSGNIVYSNVLLNETIIPTTRPGYYPAREAEPDDDSQYGDAADIDFIMTELEDLLGKMKYGKPAADSPWKTFTVTGITNGDVIESILDVCISDVFWDAYQIDEVYQDGGVWHVVLRYAYLGVKSNSYYDPIGDRVILRKEATFTGTGASTNYYYVIYETGEFQKNGNTFTVESKVVADGISYPEMILVESQYYPEYETYSTGDILYNIDGTPIVEQEVRYIYETITQTSWEEIMVPIGAQYNPSTKQYTIHIDNEVDWDTTLESVITTYRAVTPQETINTNNTIIDYNDYLLRNGAAISVNATITPFEEGSYIQPITLIYSGQNEVYQDGGTDKEPIVVLQRVIKQAIKVTKRISQSSYDGVNSYSIHNDPFTVLFGGYNGREPAKTMKGFYFKVYLKSDLEKTGLLEIGENGAYDYESFFDALYLGEGDYSGLDEQLALEWDKKENDEDGDLTTVHANLGGGKEVYYGESIALPYGTYVVVEQQPKTIPTKHYKKDIPKEVVIPFAPQIDSNGGVNENVSSQKYLYDGEMSPEELEEQYFIRFNEESHVIKAHNHDGDFEVYKYGLDMNLQQPYVNSTVAEYYRYSSTSEHGGVVDGVYYETYRDRDGNVTGYGVTLDGVKTMTGASNTINRKYAQALVPWSILEPVTGGIINDNGDIGNREPGLELDGGYNFVGYSPVDFENTFYSSKLRIEKLDSETMENIIHEGALFKIYAAKRDISGVDGTEVEGSGNILWNENGTPQYDESEQIIMRDTTGAEVGIFRAYSTVRDGEVEDENGNTTTEKRGVGYIETYQPLGAGVYVLVEVKAPEGYVSSNPIPFEIYSDKVEWYQKGEQNAKVIARQYQYVMPDGTEIDISAIDVENSPIKIEIHKVEAGEKTLTYKITDDETFLKARGDVELAYDGDGHYLGYGYATKTYDEWSETIVYGTEEELKVMSDVLPAYGADGSFLGYGVRFGKYVPKATLALYQAIAVKQVGDHQYDGITVYRNWNSSVTRIEATNTGYDVDIRNVDMDGKDIIWDVSSEANPSMQVWRYDLTRAAMDGEIEEVDGVLYGLDQYGNRICYVDSETGMAYTTDEKGNILVWPIDNSGNKIPAKYIDLTTDSKGDPSLYGDLEATYDEHGLVLYYKNGQIQWSQAEWVTPESGGHEVSRIGAGAYIIEELGAPESQGYIKTISKGIIIEETTELQHFYLKDDYTKVEIGKIDLHTREVIQGAEMTLYYAERIYDATSKGWHLEILHNLDGSPMVYQSWISGYEYNADGNLKLDRNGDPIPTTKPYWLDHIPPGDYILEETVVPHDGGYVQSESMEVVIAATSDVQQFLMEDDHTGLEILKFDTTTGTVVADDNPAILALYGAKTDENGEAVFVDGIVQHDLNKLIFQWQTQDGTIVAETGRLVELPGGHTYMEYDYDIQSLPNTENGVYYFTETGAIHMEYLPVGKYVLVEIEPPEGMATADPIYINLMEIGITERVQTARMKDEPIVTEFYKLDDVEGKSVAGAQLAIYKAKEDGSLSMLNDGTYDNDYLYEAWISGTSGRYTQSDMDFGNIPEGFAVGDLKPHRIEKMPTGDYYFVEYNAPFGYARATAKFSVTDTSEIQRIIMVNRVIRGRLEIYKHEEGNVNLPLGGATFRFTNIDTNESVLLVTGTDGKVLSGYFPVGLVARDGTIEPYTFKIEEVSAPPNHMLSTYIHEFQFPCDNDEEAFVTYTYEAANIGNQVKVSKLELTGEKELVGAGMEVKFVTRIEDDNGSVTWLEGDTFDEWTSNGQPHYLYDIPTGWYVLIETRTPSEGYALAEKIYFEVKENMIDVPHITMYDKHTEVEILKLDEDTEDFLPGSQLQLIKLDENLEELEIIKEWITGEEAEYFKALVPGFYMIKEISAPDGYSIMNPVVIEVKEEWNMQQFIVRNYQIEVHVHKIDGDENDITYVKGATLKLVRDMDSAFVAVWKTGTEAKVFKGLLPGTYTLSEIASPEGWQLLEHPIKIVITTDNGIQNFYMENYQIEVEIDKLDSETSKALLGATLQLIQLDEDLNEMELIKTWITGDEPVSIKGVPEGMYMIKEIDSPEGYSIIDPIIIEITKDEGVQKFIVYNEPIQISIIKVDADDWKPLPNAKLQLLRIRDGVETIVKEWTTDETGEAIFKGIPEGIYFIREVNSPEGYQLLSEPMEITITKDSQIQIFTVSNQKTRLEILKVDEETGESLAGAHMELSQTVNGEKKIIKDWITTTEAKEFIGLAEGSYILTELSPPPGYQHQMEPMEIIITDEEKVHHYSFINRQTELEILKEDESGNLLVGATLRLESADGTLIGRWKTNGEAKVFRGLKAGVYYLSEVDAPSGYRIMPERIAIELTTEPEVHTYAIENILTELEILKVDADSDEPLIGAVFQLTKKDGTFIRKWTTTEASERFIGLEAGTYILIELKAPEGYAPRFEPVEIEITKEDKIHIVKFENKLRETNVSKLDRNTENFLAGAMLQLIKLDSDGNEAELIREWETGTEVETFYGLLPGKYLLKEIKAPSGYKLADSIIFEITEIDANQTFTIRNFKKDGSGGGSNKEYIYLYKRAASGSLLSGAEITVYNPDGTILTTGTSDSQGRLRIERPKAGTYTFKETKAPEGYILNNKVYSFTIDGAGNISGDDTIINYPKTTTIITKKDMDTEENLKGATIHVFDSDGKLIYEGITDSQGQISLTDLIPGYYSFREIEAPEGYILNTSTFAFVITQEGIMEGNDILYNSKEHIVGNITGEVISPKTGDGADIRLIIAITGIILSIILMLWAFRKKSSIGMMMLFLCVAILPAKEVWAMEPMDDGTYRTINEYESDNPDTEYSFEKSVNIEGKEYILSDVDYLVEEVSVEAISKPLVTLHTKFSEVFFTKEEAESYKPETSIIHEDTGLFFDLKEYFVHETMTDGKVHEEERVIIYESIEWGKEVSDKISVQVENSALGNVNLPLVTSNKINERWEDGFAAILTFSAYDSDGFMLGDVFITKSQEGTGLESYGEEVLNLLGLPTIHYQVGDIRWQGDSYQNDDGTVVRNALVTGKKMVWDVQATYWGLVELTGTQSWQIEAIYEYVEEVFSTMPIYKIQAIAKYEQKATTSFFRPEFVLVGIFMGGCICVLFKRRLKGNEVK